MLGPQTVEGSSPEWRHLYRSMFTEKPLLCKKGSGSFLCTEMEEYAEETKNHTPSDARLLSGSAGVFLFNNAFG